MLTLTFTAHVEPDGRMAVICHDDMADMVKMPVESFVDKQADLVKNMKRKLLQYAQTLLRPAEGVVEDEASGPVDTFLMTDSGFPILSDVMDLNGLRQKDLAQMLRTYLGQHYSWFISSVR